MKNNKGSFTLPGEAGYEKLTLQMAEKWGADIIRDSDGTELSKEIIDAGYGIYSTVCIIRDHNEWAKKNPDALQQTFLMTSPIVAVSEKVTIDLIKDFFEEQFQINDSKEAMKYYQVFDRTTDTEITREDWYYQKETKQVVINNCKKWHKYTVNFLVYRIWEEISMYNHVTNHWDKEHLMQIDPRSEKAQYYMLSWMEQWCKDNPATTVVRFTSMFYNFVWIWGSSDRNRNLFTDWGSYDFTVSPLALNCFEEEFGYRITAEDFIQQGKYQVTHMPPTRGKTDWMKFINDFVIEFGKKLIDIVHEYGKKAYIFYDDSWVGIEPYNGRFHEFGFDGIIKCVFSGYEARLCSGVEVETHELRLHPYLFPVGLGGAPTFMEGGNPVLDAKKYWVNVRRALLRSPIERIGLGGYLHLIEKFPDFCDYIEQVADEFRTIKALHENCKPHILKTKVAVLHCWGKLRSWTLSGHFHETDSNDLIHINEALSGMPVDVDFINFEDIKNNKISDYQIIINAGYAESAWSGGAAWKDGKVIENLTKWVYEGGYLIGVNSPSAADGFDTYFRMAHVFGVDEDRGARICHGKWNYQVEKDKDFMSETLVFPEKKGIYLTDGNAKVLAESENGIPTCTMNSFGAGKGIYLSGFLFSNQTTDFLLRLIQKAGKEENSLYLSDNVNVECAFFPEADTLIVINNSDRKQSVKIATKKEQQDLMMDEYEARVIKFD